MFERAIVGWQALGLASASLPADLDDEQAVLVLDVDTDDTLRCLGLASWFTLPPQANAAWTGRLQARVGG